MSVLLPPEILLVILEDVHVSQDLQSCSVVCRSWYEPSQALIFRSIKILKKPHSDAFYTHLQRWPHLAPYVRNLSILANNSIPSNFHARILLLLTKLSSLSVTSALLTPQLHDGLASAFRRPSFISLDLVSCHGRVEQFRDLILQATSLRCLSLMGLILTEDIGDTNGILKDNIQVTKLALHASITSNGILDRRLLNGMDLTTIQTLSIGCRRRSHHLPEVVTLVGATLLHCTVTSWSFHISRKNLPPCLNFARNVNLKSLQFIVAFRLRKKKSQPEPWLLTALTSIPTAAPLQKLVIVFQNLVADHPVSAEQVQSWDYSSWENLAFILASHPFCLLPTIKLALRDSPTRLLSEDKISFLDMVKGRMAQLGSRLDFVIEIKEDTG